MRKATADNGPGDAGPSFSLSSFRNDLFGGLTAAVVALPLALAFGVASGAGAMAGLYGAIAVGFFAALFGGTPSQISGPTGPMTVVMGAVVATHADNLMEAFTIVSLGGVIQMSFGFLRLGRYISYTPYSVVSGFMTGIGLIIIILQSLPFLGLEAAGGGVIGTVKVLSSLDPAVIDPHALLLATGALLLIVFWPAQLGKFVPSALGVLVIGTLAATYLVPGLPVIGEVPQGLPSPVVPHVSLGSLPQMLQAAFILALLGSIDSLLTSLVADSITRTQHRSDQELIGQGIGNLLAGLIGGLPGAGATMRTVVNVRAGGRTRLSGMVHALVLLAIALGLGPLVAKVPHAILAAILMKVGWDIIDWGYLRRLRRAPREKILVMVVTLVLTVFVDLITAVAVGIIMASFVTSRWLAEEQLKGIHSLSEDGDLDSLDADERALLAPYAAHIQVTFLVGSFSYASAREIARRAVPGLTGLIAVIYDFTHARYVDTSAALAIDEMIELAQSQGQAVFVAGLDGQALEVLEGLEVLKRLPEGHCLDTRKKAIEAAVAYVAGLEEKDVSTP